MSKMKTYSVQLTDREYEWLCIFAKSEERSVSYLIRKAVQIFLKSEGVRIKD